MILKKLSILILFFISINVYSQIPKFALYPQIGVGLNSMQMDIMNESNLSGSYLFGGAADFGEKNLFQIGFFLHEHNSKHNITISGNSITAKLNFSNYETHLLLGRSFTANENLDIRIYAGPSLIKPYDLAQNSFQITEDDLKAVNLNLKVKLQFNITIFNVGAEYAWGMTDVLDNTASKWDYFNLIVGLTIL